MATLLRTEKEAEIEKALLQGKRWNVIAKTLHVSNRTIAKVAKRMKEVSPSQAFKMFEEGASPMQVVVVTNEKPATIRSWFEDWLKMNQDWSSWREFKGRTASSAVEKDGKEGEAPDWRDVFKRRNRKD